MHEKKVVLSHSVLRTACIAEKGSAQLSLPTSVKKQFHIAYKSKDVLSARALTSFTTYSTEEIRLGISTERPITTPRNKVPSGVKTYLRFTI